MAAPVFYWKKRYFGKVRVLFVIGLALNRSLKSNAILSGLKWYFTSAEHGVVKAAILANSYGLCSSFIWILYAYIPSSILLTFSSCSCDERTQASLVLVLAYFGALGLYFKFHAYDGIWLLMWHLNGLVALIQKSKILSDAHRYRVADIIKSPDQYKKRYVAHATLWARVVYVCASVLGTLLWVSPDAIGVLHSSWTSAIIIVCITTMISAATHQSLLSGRGLIFSGMYQACVELVKCIISGYLKIFSRQENSPNNLGIECGRCEEIILQVDTDGEEEVVEDGDKDVEEEEEEEEEEDEDGDEDAEEVKVAEDAGKIIEDMYVVGEDGEDGSDGVLKSLLKILPMWLVFLVLFTILATMNAFFLQQYNNLHTHNDRAVLIYSSVQGLSSFAIDFLYHRISFLPKNEAVQIGVGMFCGILSCIFARELEVYRLADPGNEYNTYIFISFLWLVPQFCMLGCMEGLTDEGLLKFYKSKVKERQFQGGLGEHVEVMMGLGKLLSVYLIFVRKSWLGDIINDNRLDKYYLVLIYVGLAKFIAYCCIARYCYKVQESTSVEIRFREGTILRRTKIVVHQQISPSQIIRHGRFCDLTYPFSTVQVFNSCKDMMEWVQNTADNLGYVIDRKRSKTNPSGYISKIILVCGPGGVHISIKGTSKTTSTKETNGSSELVGKYTKDHDFDALKNEIPNIFHPYITSIQDVISDGHCGFRAIALCLGLHEDQWPKIRSELLHELIQNRDRYESVFSKDFDEMHQSLYFEGTGSASQRNWMIMPDTAVLIANRFGVPVLFLSKKGSNTCFPLWKGPEDFQVHRALTVAHVGGDHYVMVQLEGDYPIPTTMALWNQHKNIAAKSWESLYEGHLDVAHLDMIKMYAVQEAGLGSRGKRGVSIGSTRKKPSSRGSGSFEESFTDLPFYFHNIKKTNPGTFTDILTDEMSRFEVLFLAFGVAIHSFKNYLRPLLIVKATHLKGEFKGTMFLAVGMDGNNQNFPVGYGIGKKESGNNWIWFMEKLRECIGEIPDLVFISDRANSIELAIKTVFPDAHHVICCLHLMMNLRGKGRKSKKNEGLFWKMCKAYRQVDFAQLFEQFCLRVPDARETLKEVGFHRWSRAHSIGMRYSYMTLNSAESFNVLSTDAKKLPITKLVDFFREELQKWFYERREDAAKNKNPLTDFAEKKMGKRISRCVTWCAASTDNNHFEVWDRKWQNVVDLSGRSCSCQVWQMSGLPCGHAVTALRQLNVTDCSDYAMPWFSNDIYKRTYEWVIYPPADESDWERPEHLNYLRPPHMDKRPTGRPRKNTRIPSQGEEPREPSCTRCFEKGHMRDQCIQPSRPQHRKQQKTKHQKQH